MTSATSKPFVSPADESSSMEDVVRILLPEERILARVAELGRQITQDYAGRDLVLIGVLKGSLIFLADLTRYITLIHSLDMVGAQSYSAGVHASERIAVTKDVDQDLRGRDILIIEDIYDTGGTMRVMMDMLKMYQPASVEVCALLSKKKPHANPIEIKYVGFEIEDVFVVGYGLDYKERYRNLRYVGVLNPEVYL